MKTFTNCAEKKAKQILNLLQGYTKGIRFTAILVLLLMGVSNAWADNCGFWGDGAASITITVNGTDKTPSDLNSNGVSDFELGTVTTSLTIKSAWAKVWGKDQFNGIKLYYRIKGEDASSSATYSSVALSWGNNFNSNDQYWHNTSINKTISINLAPGDYEIEYYFMADAKSESDKYLSNGGGNYHANFTIPSKKLSVAAFPNSNTVSGNKTGITVGTTYTITANPAAGYKFSKWTATSGAASVTIANASSASTTVTFKNYSNDATVTAEFVTTSSKTVYLKPTGYWNTASPRFVAHVWNNSSSKDIVMDPIGCASTPDYYTCEIPAGYHSMLFFREKSDGSEKWNKTTDLTIPTNNTTCYTISSTGDGMNTGASGSWGTYSAPSYEITLNPTVGGLIQVTPTGGSATNSNTSVTVNTKVKVTLLPNTGYATGTAKIKIGRNSEETLVEGQEYEICANTTITAEFIPTNPTPVYLKVADHNWKNDNAWFAIYWWNSSGNGWSKMTAVDCNGDYYYGEVAASAAHFVFVRLIPEGHKDYKAGTNGDGMSWDNDWAQTEDLLLPEESSNLYTVGSKSGEKYTGSWSAYSPTYDATINITGKGSIIVDGETYTGTSEGTTTQKIEKITLNHTIEVGAITPAERWAYSDNATIKIGTNEQTSLTENSLHAICGPTNINITFTQTECEVVFNLNLPNGTEHPIIPAQYVAVGEKATQPTLNEINGHIFGGWYSDENCTQAYNFENSVTTDITLYAKWIPYSKCIFFKNTLDWKNVYVYTFSNNVWYDNEDPNTQYGPGVCTKTQNNLHYGEMTQIGESDIFYFILPTTTGFNYIAFSDFPMNDWNEFYGHNAIYRSDRSDQMQLFIPQKEQSPSITNSTKYYSSGIWMKYNSTESGYDWRGATDEHNQEQWSKKYDFTASKPGGYSFTATVEFDNTSTHYFKIHNTKGDWFGNGGTMTQENCTDWTFGTNNTENAKITPTITGKYIFTVYLGDGEVKVSLDYPLSVNDYRLVYTDNTHGAHDGHYIKKRTDKAEQRDTVSFFIHKDNSPKILLQYCSEISNDGKPTWLTTATYTSLGDAVNSTAVYNFILKQTNNGNTHSSSIVTAETHKYTGDYYIRTDAAEGGWDSFRQKSNQITYSSFADRHSNFNHYYCKYIEAGRNVKFTIANDYSYCISDTLDNDLIIEKGQSSVGCLPINANVRFGWDSNTNEISRAYIKGAGMTSDRFLVLQGNEHLKDANGNAIPKGTGVRTGLEANEEILVDQQNWIYQVDVTANKSTLIKLIADYNGTTQYFKGSDKEYTGLLSSTASKDYKIRLVYDFKSNHLVTAWLAGGNIVEGEKVLGADMMVIRKDQGQAEQLNFDPTNSKMNEVGTGYAVMTFTQPHITDNTKTERERSLYWVSFPFDVKVSDVFGFGEYAEHWILQYYDGAERAEKGLFNDSGTYWKYIEDKNTTLWAGTGYVLALDLNKIEFLHGAEEVSLYFPSINPLTMISGELTEAIVPEHWCNIDREWTENDRTYHHKYTDSHWNLIGVPGFADINFDLNVTKYHFMQDDASFYYNFNLAESTYAVEASQVTEFQAMYAYMVQFAGTIDWTSSTVVGATPTEPKLAARRYSDEQPEKVVLCLELAQGEKETDRTFIQLQQEGATANFDLSLDLTKIMNSGFSNIYTLTDSLKIQVAGNALPMEETIVPVGVNIATAGEYTFRMPDGTEGMVVELIDYEANTTTNLLLDDYTVNLPTGSNETRFALSIKPEKTATNVGNIGGTMNDGQGVRKFIIDGKLYLQKDGMLYDAQGHIVR